MKTSERADQSVHKETLKKGYSFNTFEIKLVYPSIQVNLAALSAISVKQVTTVKKLNCVFLYFSFITKCKNYFLTSQTDGMAFA